MKFHPTPQVPALQYVGNVDPGGSADLAGMQQGDFIIEVNSQAMVSPVTALINTVALLESVATLVSSVELAEVSCMKLRFRSKHARKSLQIWLILI